MILPCDQSTLAFSAACIEENIAILYIVLEAASSLMTVLEKYMLPQHYFCYILIKEDIVQKSK